MQLPPVSFAQPTPAEAVTGLSRRPSSEGGFGEAIARMAQHYKALPQFSEIRPLSAYPPASSPTSTPKGTGAFRAIPVRQILPGTIQPGGASLSPSASSAARAYAATASALPSASMEPGAVLTQVAKYKEDQLLAHPGGDYYFHDRVEGVYNPEFDRGSFVNRMGKDLDDVGANLKNFVKDLMFGAKYKYVDEKGQIKEAQRGGLVGTVVNFFEDILSGLTFGAYTPAGEKAPEGVVESVGHFFKKIFYDAIVKDLAVGVPHTVINAGKDAALAALNLVQIVPDATIGNFEWGQKLTTTVFDNGQVAVDYLTDIIPGGNAWLRVHAAGSEDHWDFPIFFNFFTQEAGLTDPRWATVRNTPFRKTIETIGALVGDTVIGLSLSRQFPGTTSTDRRQP
jgi:hypothetical protein